MLSLASVYGALGMQAPQASDHVFAMQARPKRATGAAGHHALSRKIPETLKQASDAAPAPAEIRLEGGRLSIAAENADLNQILIAVAHRSGMSIQGQVTSSRVFGSFGPGTPEAVLADLLAGTGYNFIMSGVTPDGVPRSLLLSPESTRSTTAAAAPPHRAEDAEDRERLTEEAREREQLGPGAVAHPAPPPSSDPQVRMQQHLDRLKRMQEQVKQQNPQ